MAKGAYIGVGGVAHKIKGGYIGIDGVAHKIKKGYIGVNGVAQMFFGGVDVATMGISYTGTMTDKVVTMSGVQYRLLELKKSGTLTIDQEVNAEVWMCSGGAKGANGSYSGTSSANSLLSKGGAGGAGGKFIQYTTLLAKSTVVTVGAAAGVSQVGDITSTSDGCITGSGGGKGGAAHYKGSDSSTKYGSGGAKAKGDTRPFADPYFSKYPCAGGGGGLGMSKTVRRQGGYGGSSTGAGTAGSSSTTVAKGGTTGGGDGGYVDLAPKAATYYGSGGGGGDCQIETIVNGKSGYQGVVYIRIPLEQSA